MFPLRKRLRAVAWLTLSAAAATVASWALLLAFPDAVERVEVHVLSLALWWRAGHVPWQVHDRVPLLQNPYGPVVLWWISRVGADAGYLAGRVLSVVSALGCAALVGAWTAARVGPERRLPLALIAAALPLLTKPWVLFGPLARVDSAGLLLALGGFVLATGPTPGRGRDGGALLLWAAAFATKATLVAAPLAVVLARSLDPRLEVRAAGRRLGLGVVVALGSVLGLLELLAGGTYLANVGFGNLPGAPGKCLDMGLRMLLPAGWLIGLALAGPPPVADGGRCGRPSARPALAYLAVATVLALVTAANPLSSWNYLMEPVLALALVTGPRLEHAGDRALRWMGAHAALSLVLVVAWSADRHLEAVEHSGEVAAAVARLRGGTAASGGSFDAAGLLGTTDLATWDALNRLGVPNAVAVPAAIAERPEVRRFLADEVGEGTVLLVGPGGEEPGPFAVASEAPSVRPDGAGRAER